VETKDRIPLVIGICLPLIFALLFTLAPRSIDIEKSLASARLSLEAHQPGLEAGYLRQVISLEPWRVDLWEKVADLELTAGKTKDAINAFQQAIEANKLSPDGWLALAEAYKTLNDPDMAISTYQTLVQSGKATDQAFEQLAQLQWQNGKLDDAVSTYQSWLKFNPKNPQAAFNLGLLMIIAQPEKASTYLKMAASQDSSLVPQVEALQRPLQVANAIGQDDIYRLVLTGRSLGNLGYWDLAYQAFLRSTALDPEYAEAWAFLGEAQQHLGKDGLLALEKAQKLDPQSILVQAMSGLYWRRQGHPEKALVLLDAIVKKEPDQAIWQVEMGNVLAEMGVLGSALEHFQAAIALEPGSSPNWQSLAQFSISRDIQPETVGLNAARQSVILTPNDPAALDTMGSVLYALSDMQGAERFFLRALVENSQYAPAHLHLGQVYLQTNHLNQAYTQLKQAASLAAKNTETDDIAQRLLKQYFKAGS
jgi:tetratricopeptide (TPR) repeat protein